MRLLQANIVYCSPNVYLNVNNVLSYVYNYTTKTITFEQGLYSLEDINYKIALATQEHFNTDNLFHFSPDTSTSKFFAVIKATVTIYCDVPYSIMPLLGFPKTTGDIIGADKK